MTVHFFITRIFSLDFFVINGKVLPDNDKEKRMVKDILKSYLKDIHHKFSQGDAREESFYPIMEQMILSVASFLGKSKVDVTTLV